MVNQYENLSKEELISSRDDPKTFIFLYTKNAGLLIFNPLKQNINFSLFLLTVTVKKITDSRKTQNFGH